MRGAAGLNGGGLAKTGDFLTTDFTDSTDYGLGFGLGRSSALCFAAVQAGDVYSIAAHPASENVTN
jgi:hypothetical protein